MTSATTEIDWKSLGVFTDESSFNELLALFTFSLLGFGGLYILNKLYFD